MFRRSPSARLAWVIVSGILLLAGCTRDREAAMKEHMKKGEAFFTERKYREAILEYRNAVRLDQRSGEARYRLALAYIRVDDGVNALREMARAADLSPENTDAQLQAGMLLLFAGRYDDAAARARRVLERDVANVDALVLLGNASAGLRQSDEALSRLAEAARSMPDEPRLQESIGMIERRRGNLDEAEAAFKNAVKAAPNSVSSRLALANYYWSVGRAADVEATLEGALPLEGSDAMASRNLALFYVITRRDADAEPHLRKVVQARPGDSSAGFALAGLYARTGRLEQAMQTLEALVARDETFAAATARLAFFEHQAGRRDAAYARLERARQKMPKSADLRAMQARLLLADRKYDEVLTTARAVVAADPKRYDGHYLLGSALLETGRHDEALASLREAESLSPRAIGSKVQLGRLSLLRGDLEGAERYARDALRLNPDADLARLLLVRVLAARGKTAEAEQVLARLAKELPNSPEVQTQVGTVALLKQDLTGARRAFTRALELDPRSAEALAGLVGVDARQGRQADSLALVKRRLAESPNDPALLLLGARTFLAAKDTKTAEELLQRAINAPAVSMEASSMLAGLYFQERRLDQARAAFEELARKQPKSPGPATMVGIILQMQNKPREAQTVYEKLLATNVEAPVAANNLAMLLVEGGGNLDVALNHAQAAKKALPDDPDINDTLGLVYLKKGLGTLAVSAFDQSARVSPGNPVYWWHLGQAHALAGDRRKARDALNRALSLNPNFDGAAEARKALADLDRAAPTP